MFALLMSLMIARPSFAADAPKIPAETMQKLVAAGTPGAAHRRLSDMAGDYTYVGKSWHSADQKTPMEDSGSATMTMILGGRWLQYSVKGSGSSGGMPAYEGMGLIGYDNTAKRYETSWMDTMTTGAMHGTAQFDSNAKAIKESGSYVCPVDGKDRAYHGEWKMLDKNTMVFALSGTSPFDKSNKEFKMMELTFKRK